MARRYTQEQLAQAMQKSGASSWQEVQEFITRNPVSVSDLTNDQLAEMQEDLEKLRDRNEVFTTDPGAAYGMIDSIQPTRTVIGPGSPTPEGELR